MERFTFGITLSVEKSKLDKTMKMVHQNWFSLMKCITLKSKIYAGLLGLLKTTVVSSLVLLRLNRVKLSKSGSLVKISLQMKLIN